MTKVAIIAHGALSQDRLFDPSSSRDNCLERFCKLRRALAAEGIDCRTEDSFSPAEVELLIFHDLHRELATVLRVVKANPSVKLLYVAAEPPFLAPLHDEKLLPFLPVDRVLTWNDGAVGKGRAVKCNIGQPVIVENEIPVVPFAKKQLLCCIYSNKASDAPGTLYGERLKAVDFFAGRACGFDLYGVGWEGCRRPSVIASYRGKCREKKEVLKQYKFTLAFENIRDVPGLITEKIFDCFAAGSVPVYLGAPNVTEYIPSSCFVDYRQFRGYQQLHDFLTGMPEQEHLAYLEAARRFIRTPQYRDFVSDRYVEIVVGEIRGLVKEQVPPKRVSLLKRELLKLIARNPELALNRSSRRLFWDLVTVW